MFIDDFVEIFLVNEGVPDPFRVDDQDRPFLAAIQATGRVHAHLALTRELKRLNPLLDIAAHLGGSTTATALTLSAFLTDIGTKKHVAFVVTHGDSVAQRTGIVI